MTITLGFIVVISPETVTVSSILAINDQEIRNVLPTVRVQINIRDQTGGGGKRPKSIDSISSLTLEFFFLFKK